MSELNPVVMSEVEPRGAAGPPLHVVFGATGGIGRAVTEELLWRGRRVRAVSRRGDGIEGAERISVDASQPDAAAAAAAGAVVVYHCVNPGYTQWPELLPPVSRSILHAAEAAGAKLVYADNLYAYGPVEGPLREDLPAVATGRKGRARVEVAAEMLAAQRDHACGSRSDARPTTTAPTERTRTPESRYSGAPWRGSARSGTVDSTSPTRFISCPTSREAW
jgi:NAD(P)H-binding